MSVKYHTSTKDVYKIEKKSLWLLPQYSITLEKGSQLPGLIFTAITKEFRQ